MEHLAQVFIMPPPTSRNRFKKSKKKTARRKTAKKRDTIARAIERLEFELRYMERRKKEVTKTIKALRKQL